MKVLLLVLVVLVHSSYASLIDGQPYSEGGLWINNFITNGLACCAVPGYFMLAGYLFFKNVRSFSWLQYGRKLHSRVFTLLIPYILWNLICGGLHIVKHLYLGYPSLGLFVDGEFCPAAFARGFIDLDNTGRPMAFAFWFIRNLMLMAVLAPAVYVAARRWWLALPAVLFFLFGPISSFGLEYFIIGAYLAMHPIAYRITTPRRRSVVAAYVAMAACMVSLPVDYLFNLPLIVTILLGIASWYSISCSKRVQDSALMTLIMPAAFFIYASHQCYVSILRGICVKLCGIDSIPGSVMSVLSTWLAEILLSYLIYRFLKHFMPKILSLLTGARA